MNAKRTSAPRTSDQSKRIHHLKNLLNLDDETYRAVLSGYGVASSKDLSLRDAGTLIQDFTAKAIAAGVWSEKTKGQSRPLAATPEAKMIRGLWIELHQYFRAGAVDAVRDSSEKALGAFVYRMAKVSALQWVRGRQATAIIEALKEWRDRARIDCFRQWFNRSYPGLQLGFEELGRLEYLVFGRELYDLPGENWLEFLGEQGNRIMVEYVEHCRASTRKESRG